MHLHSLQKEQRDNSNTKNKTIRQPQYDDAADTLNSNPSSQTRRGPETLEPRGRRNPNSSTGLSDIEFGRLYEQKRLAQIQNICVGDVVEEVKLVSTSFENSRSKRISQSNVRSAESKGDEASHGGKSRLR